jgi:hypothetical protein
MRPRLSSVPLILVFFRCHPQAKYTAGCGGGEEEEQERWGTFDPDADLQPEGEEEIPVFQPDTAAGGRGRGTGKPGRESYASQVKLARAASLVVSSDRPLEVRAMLGRPGRTARALPSITHPSRPRPTPRYVPPLRIPC